MMITLMTACSSTKTVEESDTTAETQSTEAAVETSAVTEAPSATETPASAQTPTSTNVTEEAGFSITDMTDRTITFDKVPEKMVVLLASDVEILYELGAQDSIVAVGEYCNYPEDALSKEIITTGDDMNIEQIIALEADVVVMGMMGQTTEQIEQLENAGIKVLVTDSQNIADVYVATQLLGKLSGKDTEAADLIQSMKDEFAAIQSKADGANGKTVYFEVSPLEYGLWTAGTDTFMQELADIVGLKNAFDDISGWAEISEEQVLERNPDYIVTSTMYFGEGVKPVDEILGRANWEEVAAVKNGNVYNGDSDMMTRPGPRLVDAAKALYDFVYGE
jgi:iron complex transport system substrate-binding protein